MVDRTMFDRHIEKPLNTWRAELGLEPVHRIFRGWLYASRRVIGLFPDWFGSPQPDWPSTARPTGFPLFDETGQHEPDPELEAFLKRDAPPIVFTPGSANEQAARFFEAAIGATQQLQQPARAADALRTAAATEPARSRSTPIVCASLTGAAPLRSDRPSRRDRHLRPGTGSRGPAINHAMGYDQPDNATRLGRLGVGAWLEPRKFTANRLAAALQHLLESTQVAASCRRYASLIKASDANEQTL